MTGINLLKQVLGAGVYNNNMNDTLKPKLNLNYHSKTLQLNNCKNQEHLENSEKPKFHHFQSFRILLKNFIAVIECTSSQLFCFVQRLLKYFTFVSCFVIMIIMLCKVVIFICKNLLQQLIDIQYIEGAVKILRFLNICLHDFLGGDNVIIIKISF